MSESLFCKVADLRPLTLLKKIIPQVFSWECFEIFKNIFFSEHQIGTDVTKYSFINVAFIGYLSHLFCIKIHRTEVV